MQKNITEKDAVCKKYRNNNTNVAKWSTKDLQTVLKTYRINKDEKIPTKKSDLLELYSKWKHCSITKFNGRVIVDDINLLMPGGDKRVEEETVETGGGMCLGAETSVEPDIKENSTEVSISAPVAI